MRFEVAPAERIDDHPALLAEFMRIICDLGPGDYALSDESLLSDMSDFGANAEPLYTAVRHRYGLWFPTGESELYLWQVIDAIARQAGPLEARCTDAWRVTE